MHRGVAHSTLLAMLLVASVLAAARPVAGQGACEPYGPLPPDRPARDFFAEVAVYTRTIRAFNPGLDAREAHVAARDLLGASRAHDVDPRLVLALGVVESNWRLHVRGAAGEVGPLQVHPLTLEWLEARNPGDWREALWLGVRYLGMAVNRSDGHRGLAVARYNAGINSDPVRAFVVSGRYAGRVLQCSARIQELRRRQ